MVYKPQSKPGPQGPQGLPGSPEPGVYLFKDFNVPNNFSADASPAINTAIQAIPDFSILMAEPGGKYLIGSTILLIGRTGVSLVGSISPEPDNGNGVVFKWSGVAGGTVIHLQYCGRCEVNNFYIETESANIGVLVDGEGGPRISTRNTVSGNVITNTGNRSTWVGCSLSPNDGNNNEFMIFQDNHFFDGTNLGVGLLLGNNSNAHCHTITRNVFEMCGIGLYAKILGATATVSYNGFEINTIDIKVDSVAGSPSHLIACDSENSQQFLVVTGGATNPLTISHSRIYSNGIAGKALIELHGGGFISFFNNAFDPPVSGAWVYDGSNITGMSITLSQNFYISIAQGGYDSNGLGHAVFNNMPISNNSVSLLLVNDPAIEGYGNGIYSAGHSLIGGMLIQGIGQAIGSNVASFQVSSCIHPVTGNSTIHNINLAGTPFGSGGLSNSVTVTLLSLGGFATDTSGNIAAAISTTIGHSYRFTYNTNDSKWYPG